MNRESEPLRESPACSEPLAAAALWYVNRRIPVFPLHSAVNGRCSCGKANCDSPGKHPRTPHGFKDATSDPNQITAWWEQWPDANIGVPTGAASGWLVVDVDPRNGGAESFDRLLAEHGRLPVTAEQMTGGGGLHIVFKNITARLPKRLAQGIDLKGDGGYIVVAPSVHATGGVYQWNGIAGRNAVLSPAEAPQWLIALIASVTDIPPSEAPTRVEKWGEGGRNDALTSFGGSMRRRGMSEESIAAALLEENRRRCYPPLPESEVRRIAESVAAYPPGDGRTRARNEEGGFEASGANWPLELEPEGYHGIAGDLVRLIEPHSEADPAALLVQFLIGFGSLIGRRAHFKAEADRHYLNLFAVIVGQTAKARKGTSLGQIQRVLGTLDPAWSDGHVKSGLASGEGLIWAVRDEIRERVPIRQNGRVTGYEEVVTDEGEPDKRLLIAEPEFARVLQVTERDQNTLSAIMRQAWDTGTLRILTKKQAAASTDAHISIIGHITKDELRRLLSDTAAANGFANRFLWICARRSKYLPDGGELHKVDFGPVMRRIGAAIEFAREVDLMHRDEKARAIWHGVYQHLSEGRPGLVGAVISRAEAQTMRLACIYALLDQSETVRPNHLMAALAVWRYCEDSATFIFGNALGDATADEIYQALRNHVQGMTRTEIREHFSRNKSSAEIGRALGVLQEYGLARVVREREQEGQIRPTERWFCTR